MPNLKQTLTVGGTLVTSPKAKKLRERVRELTGKLAVDDLRREAGEHMRHSAGEYGYS